MHVEAVYIDSYLSAFKNKCRHYEVALCTPELVTRYSIYGKCIVCRLFWLKSAKHESYFRYACIVTHIPKSKPFKNILYTLSSLIFRIKYFSITILFIVKELPRRTGNFYVGRICR